MSVKLMAVTRGVGELQDRDAQDVISYITRVSNSSNQANFDTSAKLLAYCIKNQHWSPFEHAFLTIEIETSRAIAAQILRHRSFTFQEFSQRYAKALDVLYYEARQQDVKNRQNSTDTLNEETKKWFQQVQEEIWKMSYQIYSDALDKGVAKECARFILPLNTATKIYMTGSARSWIHYIQLRCDKATQLEHRIIADGCKAIFLNEFPDIAKALEWQ